jgi:regulator of protease activity HflC (stomatin/prohibitin superfamily)
MVPMPPLLRLDAWLRLEKSLNTLLSLQDELYFITGPLFLVKVNAVLYFRVVDPEKAIVNVGTIWRLPANLPKRPYAQY